MNDSPILIHVWSVRPDQMDALVDRLAGLFDRVRGVPGFVSARILASADRESVAALVEMRSAEDRQRLQALPDVHDTLYGVSGAYNLMVRLYDQIEAFGVEAHDSRRAG